VKASPRETTREEILEWLSTIEDPELGFNIVELGLIYGIEQSKDRCVVEMTLTSPACPEGPAIVAAVRDSVKALTRLPEVRVELVWDPPWDPDEMPSEDVRFILRSLR